ncbi:xanthine dehydrogenase 1-like [Pyrus ussuriensis x Pyrus communis]|uniref:Xanthine dehydrogenase 1-like n=1 Tax=Pyrus ussuriensis x Pyrus communis TaxID=2448454 RepID=A0A5N5I6F9_9ROSA|nr:xanthine dehydrogenase 1-like [Pyrus ussuriensis x Pyrus communis]
MFGLLKEAAYSGYRDAEYWDVLKIVLSDFWWNHVPPARERFNGFTEVGFALSQSQARAIKTLYYVSMQIEGSFVQGLGFVALEELKGGDPACKWISPGCLYTYWPGSYKISCINDVPFKFSVPLLKGHPNVKVIHSSKVLVRHQFSWHPPSFFAIKDAIIAAKSRSRV